MRKKEQKQLPLMTESVNHRRAKELKKISKIISDNPIINELVYQDITRGKRYRALGAEGMSAEQVLRAVIIKQMEGFSYEELAFHLVDSTTYRRFCRIGFADKGFKKSTLCNNIKKISADTLEEVNRVLVDYGKTSGVEKGREARIDSTVVDCNIHEPTDSRLLWDCVRVLTRLLSRAQVIFEEIPLSDHTRRAKRRMLGVQNAKKENIRKRQYEDLLKVTEKTVSYARNALKYLRKLPTSYYLYRDQALDMAKELKHYILLAEKVIGQTESRVIHGKPVEATQKVVSIFEPHTDVIRKDRRETYYGHKICISGGRSNLITDCVVLEGNPADTTLTDLILDRHQEIYGAYPLKVALDGGFASQDNLKKAKGHGIKDVCFAKKCGLHTGQMCRSEYVYKRLRKFRAGIESGISWLKRSFGLDRCTWKTFDSFKSYVWASVISANLLTLARRQLA